MSLKRSLLIKFKRANITNTTIDCSKECVKCITQTKLSKIYLLSKLMVILII